MTNYKLSDEEMRMIEREAAVAEKEYGNTATQVFLQEQEKKRETSANKFANPHSG
jgi:hypothetical protein